MFSIFRAEILVKSSTGPVEKNYPNALDVKRRESASILYSDRPMPLIRLSLEK